MASSKLLYPTVLLWLTDGGNVVTDGGATTIPGTKIGTGAGAQVVGTGGRSWTGEGVIAGPVIRRGGPSEGSNTAPVVTLFSWSLLSDKG